MDITALGGGYIHTGRLVRRHALPMMGGNLRKGPDGSCIRIYASNKTGKLRRYERKSLSVYDTVIGATLAMLALVFLIYIFRKK
jgi:hypothetical protein